jgi:hypothetical protein
MLRFWLAGTTALAMMAGVAVAQTSTTVQPIAPQSPGMAEPIMTMAPPTSLNGRPSEPAVVTDSEGSTATTTAPGSGSQVLPLHTLFSGPMATTASPGSGSQGVSTGEGNATGMIVPGQPPKLVSTPE